jgi:hypothetical protein
MGSMEQDTRDAIVDRFGPAMLATKNLSTLLDQFRDAVLSGPDITEHEAWRPVGDALETQLSALAVDPNNWDGDEDGVSILVRWLKQSAEWLEESIAHRIAETLREDELEHTLADKVDPWTRGADPEGWPCWVRKSDGKPVPPAWVKD